MLPSYNCPLFGKFIGEAVEDVNHQPQVVNWDGPDIVLGKLLSVLNFGSTPKEFDPHEVWPIFGIECDRYVMSLTPGHDVVMTMDTGVVKVEGPFVSLRHVVLHLDEGRSDLGVVEGAVLAIHEDLSQACADEATACHVVWCFALLPIPDQWVGFRSKCIQVGVSFDEYALVELEDVIALVLEIDESLVSELYHLLLLLDFGRLLLWWTELVDVSLKGDASAVVEALDVRWEQVTTLQ